MIFGDCPYCENAVVNAMPDRSPAYHRPTCETCGKVYWLYCSRIPGACRSYTEEEFLSEFDVDMKNRSVKRKGVAT